MVFAITGLVSRNCNRADRLSLSALAGATITNSQISYMLRIMNLTFGRVFSGHIAQLDTSCSLIEQRLLYE